MATEAQLEKLRAQVAALKEKLEKKKVHRKPNKFALAYKAWYAKNGKNHPSLPAAMKAFAKEYKAKNS